MIELSLLSSKIEFVLGWTWQILERDKWKIELKLEKCSIFQGFGGDFPICSEW